MLTKVTERNSTNPPGSDCSTATHERDRGTTDRALPCDLSEDRIICTVNSREEYLKIFEKGDSETSPVALP